MSASLLCAALALTLVPAEKPERDMATHGTIKKVDPSANRLTITLKATTSSKAPEDREFQLGEATKFVFYSGGAKKEATGKEAYKNEQFKEGAEVAIVGDGKGKALEVRVGKSPNK